MHDLFGTHIFFPSGLDRVCAGAFEDNAPSWRNDRLWQAAAGTFQYLISRHQYQMDEVRETAYTVRHLMNSIDASLDRLCGLTCIRCQAPCCLTADVSYDFRDLLIIALTGQVIPPRQPREIAGEICFYLGAKGCRIPRSRRPWICTWYICAVQKEVLGSHMEIAGNRLLQVIADIRVLRKKTEDLFVAVTAGKNGCAE